MKQNENPTEARAVENGKTLAVIEPTDGALTSAQLCERLQVHRGKLRQLMQHGLPYVTLGPRSFRFLWPDVVEALNRKSRNALE